MIDINALAQNCIDDIRVAAQELGKLKGWNVKSAMGMIKCLPMLVKKAEELGRIKDLTGSEKQQFVVAVFLRLAPLPWWLPSGFAKPLLEAAVDAIVDALKSKF